MIIDASIRKHRSYTMSDLREKMPIYDRYPPKKVVAGSHEAKLDAEPIATTNQNLHMRYDESQVIKNGSDDLQGSVFERKYPFFGLVGNAIYSSVERFTHDEEDTENSEIP